MQKADREPIPQDQILLAIDNNVKSLNEALSGERKDSKIPYRVGPPYYNFLRLLAESPNLGIDYQSKLSHDIVPILNAWKVVSFHDTPETPKICILAMKRMIESVRCEVGFNPQPVDLGSITEEAFRVIQATHFNKSMLAASIAHPTKFINNIPPETWGIMSNENAIFRMLWNVLNNSRRAIEVRYSQTNTPGLIDLCCRNEDFQTVLDVTDNGSGFNGLFEQINFSSVQPEISLDEISTHGQGVSWFRKRGVGGTGHGLGIINHFAHLLNAQVFIANPASIAGSRVSIKFPQ